VLFGVPGRLAGSAWGSDILVTPHASALALADHARAACLHADHQRFAVMADRMRELGAAEVMTFPFGLEACRRRRIPAKDEHLVFANRGLEPIYRPNGCCRLLRPWRGRPVRAKPGGGQRRLAARRAAGSRPPLWAWPTGAAFVGRLDADHPGRLVRPAQWYLSPAGSDSVSVSVLEAMAHGCIPILSDLPANRELVRQRATTADPGRRRPARSRPNWTAAPAGGAIAATIGPGCAARTLRACGAGLRRAAARVDARAGPR
jgi:hypothetical protein